MRTSPLGSLMGAALAVALLGAAPQQASADVVSVDILCAVPGTPGLVGNECFPPAATSPQGLSIPGMPSGYEVRFGNADMLVPGDPDAGGGEGGDPVPPGAVATPQAPFDFRLVLDFDDGVSGLISNVDLSNGPRIPDTGPPNPLFQDPVLNFFDGVGGTNSTLIVGFTNFGADDLVVSDFHVDCSQDCSNVNLVNFQFVNDGDPDRQFSLVPRAQDAPAPATLALLALGLLVLPGARRRAAR